jgi:hypothetical protein
MARRRRGDDASRCGRRGDRLPGWVGERCVEEGKIPVAVIHPAAADEAAGAHRAVKAHLDLKWTGTRPVPTWRLTPARRCRRASPPGTRPECCPAGW